MSDQDAKKEQLNSEMQALRDRIIKSDKARREQKAVLQLFAEINRALERGICTSKEGSWTWNVVGGFVLPQLESEMGKDMTEMSVRARSLLAMHVESWRRNGVDGEVTFTAKNPRDDGLEVLREQFSGTWKEIVHPDDFDRVTEELIRFMLDPKSMLIIFLNNKQECLMIAPDIVKRCYDGSLITVTGFYWDCTPVRQPFLRSGIKTLDPGAITLSSLLWQRLDYLTNPAEKLTSRFIDFDFVPKRDRIFLNDKRRRPLRYLRECERRWKVIQDRWKLIELAYLLLHSHWDWGAHEGLSKDVASILFHTTHCADAAVFVKDDSMRYTYVSPALRSFLNISESNLLGRTDLEVFSGAGEWSIWLIENLEDLNGQMILCVSSLARQVDDLNSGETILLMSLAHLSEDGLTRHIGVATGPGLELMDESQLGTDGCKSKAMQAVLKLALNAAKHHSTILLTGESGVGKDHLAQYIHNHSHLAGSPFFSVNCAAITEQLAESELFGHERGSFTGAVGRKRGLLELAEGGTLLLNEIAELSLPLQAKLLTFLDTRQFTRVGGEQNITVNARLIAATNRDLEKEVIAERFRQDLFYRLNVLLIEVPPLRKRREDIPILVHEILLSLCSELQLASIPEIDSSTMATLVGYSWPGNVRELRNVLERSLIVDRGKKGSLDLPEFRRIDHPPDVEKESDDPPPSLARIAWPQGYKIGRPENPGRERLCKVKKEYMKGKKCKMKQLAAALGVDRKTLYNWLKQEGLLET